MTRYITPITDRSQTDIDLNTAKAFFNILDWVRIYNNTLVTYRLVNFLSNANLNFVAIPDQLITSIPSVTTLNTFLNNIERLRLASGFTLTGMVEIKDDWLSGTAAIAPDFIDVNEWESVIDIIFNYTGPTVEYVIYCGVATSGQPRFYQHRWRQYQWIGNSVSPVLRARTGIALCGAGLKRNNYFRRYD